MKKNKEAAGYAVIIALLLITGIFSINLFFRQRVCRDRFNVAGFPAEVAGWKSKDIKMDEKDYDILETRNVLLREYTDAKDERIYLLIVYSETNRAVFHPPEVCVIGSGARVNEKSVESLENDGARIAVNRLRIEKGGSRELVLYCYKAGSLYTDNFYLQQAAFALNQLFGRRKGGALIRVSARIKSNEETTFNELKDFLQKAIRILDTL